MRYAAVHSAAEGAPRTTVAKHLSEAPLVVVVSLLV